MANEVQGRTANILVVEDDVEDQWVMRRAFESSELVNAVYLVGEGEEAMEFLLNEGEYTDAARFPRPDIILLDLNLPKLNGRDVLKWIKANEALRTIPVLVMTTSEQEEDILKTYELGVNSYITKPVDFDKFIQTVRELGHYWFEIVVLPGHGA